VGALGGDRLVLTPLLRLWNTRAKRITELDRSINHGVLLVDRERALTERWGEMKAQSRSRETSATENEVLSAVSHWASAGELAVTSLKPRWILDEEQCRKLEIQVSTTGKLASVARFLYELEIDPQALKVEDVELTARDNAGQALTCDVRFTRLVLEGDKP
jgi:Tfp pilus assembly protein PilO